MKIFFASCALFVLARLIRWHNQGCATCTAASAKGDNMKYEEFCPTGLSLMRTVEKVFATAPSR